MSKNATTNAQQMQSPTNDLLKKNDKHFVNEHHQNKKNWQQLFRIQKT